MSGTAAAEQVGRDSWSCSHEKEQVGDSGAQWPKDARWMMAVHPDVSWTSHSVSVLYACSSLASSQTSRNCLERNGL